MEWLLNNGNYERILMSKEHYNNEAIEIITKQGPLISQSTFAYGYFVVDGTIKVEDNTLSSKCLLWISGDEKINVEANENARVIYIESSKALASGKHYEIFDSAKIPWSRELIGCTTASKHMIKAEDYGVKIQTCIYTNGFYRPAHTHTYAHCFYVLNGMLFYDYENNKGIYGPGEYAINDSSIETSHGVAKGYEGSTEYLFIGDGIFDLLVDGVDVYNK